MNRYSISTVYVDYLIPYQYRSYDGNTVLALGVNPAPCPELPPKFVVFNLKTSDVLTNGSLTLQSTSENTYHYQKDFTMDYDAYYINCDCQNGQLAT